MTRREAYSVVGLWLRPEFAKEPGGNSRLCFGRRWWHMLRKTGV
jgi:hypothetical protein